MTHATKALLQIHKSVWEADPEQIEAMHEVFCQVLRAKAAIVGGYGFNDKFRALRPSLIGPVPVSTDPNDSLYRWENFKIALALCRRFEGFMKRDHDGTVTLRIRFFSTGANISLEDTLDPRTRLKTLRTHDLTVGSVDADDDGDL